MYIKVKSGDRYTFVCSRALILADVSLVTLSPTGFPFSEEFR